MPCRVWAKGKISTEANNWNANKWRFVHIVVLSAEAEQKFSLRCAPNANSNGSQCNANSEHCINKFGVRCDVDAEAAAANLLAVPFVDPVNRCVYDFPAKDRLGTLDNTISSAQKATSSDNNKFVFVAAAAIPHAHTFCAQHFSPQKSKRQKSASN